MSIWFPGSGMLWEDYLQANRFERDLNQAIIENAKSISVSIDQNSQVQVATLRQLKSAFGSGIDSLSASLEGLGARFDYSLALLLDEARVQTHQFSKMLQDLSAIRLAVVNPLQSRARERFNMGIERLAKGLLKEALQAFLQADKIDNTDFLTQLYLGKLYLHGEQEEDSIVDINEAKRHLRSAIRLGKAELSLNRNFQVLTAEALFFASIASYVSPPLLSDLACAKEFASEAVVLNPSFSEAWYHLAKYNALQENIPGSLSALDRAVTLDPTYAAKVQADGAFWAIRNHINQYLVALCSKAHKDAEAAWSSLQELHSWANALQVGEQSFSDCKEIAGSLVQTLEVVTDARATKTYLGFWQMVKVCRAARQSLSIHVDAFLGDVSAHQTAKLRRKLEHVRESGMSNLEGCITTLFVCLFFFSAGGIPTSKTEFEEELAWILTLISIFGMFSPWVIHNLRCKSKASDVVLELEELEKHCEAIRSAKAKLERA